MTFSLFANSVECIRLFSPTWSFHTCIRKGPGMCFRFSRNAHLRTESFQINWPHVRELLPLMLLSSCGNTDFPRLRMKSVSASLRQFCEASAMFEWISCGIFCDGWKGCWFLWWNQLKKWALRAKLWTASLGSLTQNQIRTKSSCLWLSSQLHNQGTTSLDFCGEHTFPWNHPAEQPWFPATTLLQPFLRIVPMPVCIELKHQTHSRCWFPFPPFCLKYEKKKFS